MMFPKSFAVAKTALSCHLRPSEPTVSGYNVRMMRLRDQNLEGNGYVTDYRHGKLISRSDELWTSLGLRWKLLPSVLRRHIV